ncbi:MAG: sulfate reduction electron transfer complex DsrMKJOP subunit DsrM [Deltaproteobacteria bacterium]
MNLVISFIAVLILALLALGIAMSHGMIFILAVVLPYAAFAVFVCGVIYRLITWGQSPVPFRIPTTCGQEKSLPWIKSSPLENPAGIPGVIGRMALEILLFRSLFRNCDMEIVNGRPVHGSANWLWFFGLLFHGSLLMIILRHLRFFTEPILPGIAGLTAVDGFLELAIPTLYLSDITLLAAAAFLLARRMVSAQLRYISQVSDYFALLLILAIAATGLWMRHIQPTDLEQVKALVMGWVSLSPAAPKGLSMIFFIHLFLICVLLAWFPASKLMHAGGVFLSPTRNQANDSRNQRHINPWNGPVPVHTYEEYENEFRDKMKAAGLPVEKE